MWIRCNQRGHRNGPKWKRTEKESSRKERSRNGIRPKIAFRLVSDYLNYKSGNGPKNIVSYFLRLDSVLLLGRFIFYTYFNYFYIRFTHLIFGPIPEFFCPFHNIFLPVSKFFPVRFLRFYCTILSGSGIPKIPDHNSQVSVCLKYLFL